MNRKPALFLPLLALFGAAGPIASEADDLGWSTVEGTSAFLAEGGQELVSSVTYQLSANRQVIVTFWKVPTTNGVDTVFRCFDVVSDGFETITAECQVPQYD
ncbi:hypothetical protein L0666_07915 [Octadecabacter sp. CECT 8868]|uniref:hypothetical protein n=1 Tax=Octadecabacter algicola TaxID=2909342 RepID=UPI001F178319|nr:hypothetical protein [Octadecabacter algicola]MCF2904910.1 hypothetical protein [Octadecabacter algicola]